ncbi:MAG: hypothetical protein KGI73_01255 [Patescibacteria group bacterium]|nr:hypothetical protein [Patescibacteria group bacterium]
MSDKKFLEEYPLYKKFTFEPRQHWQRFEIEQLPTPTINLNCKQCESTQTYNVNENTKYTQPFGVADDKIFRLQYVCTGCHSNIREFILRFQEGSVFDEGKREHIYHLQMEKVGQYPAWSIEMDEELENLLGEHANFYKSGLICESQGYGIGAFAYYRRIVEEVIDELLTSIEDLLTDPEEKSEYAAALQKVKQTTVTQEKIELVKDLLPDSLRPDGINPLAALHSALSEGLHAEDEKTCLEYAGAVRDALVFLVNRLVRTKSENKSFSASMRKILNKKNGKDKEH